MSKSKNFPLKVEIWLGFASNLNLNLNPVLLDFRLGPALLFESILRNESNGKMIGRLQLGNVNFEATYAMIGILIPMNVAVGEVIEEGISECNKMSEFLFPDYYVTNVKKLTPEEISKYLEEISHGEK